MAWQRSFALITLFLSVFTPSVFGEKCGKTVRRNDGTAVQLVFLQCPGSGDDINAHFCCGNERRHHCCTAEELMRHRKTDFVKFNESPGNMEILDGHQAKDVKINETVNVVPLSDITPSATFGEKCEKTIQRLDGTVVQLDFPRCPNSGDSKDALYCCGSKWNPICCTAKELKKQGKIDNVTNDETPKETKIISEQQANDERLLKNFEDKKTELDNQLKAEQTNETLLKNIDSTHLTEQQANDEKLLKNLEDKIAELDKKLKAETINKSLVENVDAEDIRSHGEIEETPNELETVNKQPQNIGSNTKTVIKKTITIPLAENKSKAVGEKCGKRSRHSDGTVVQIDFLQCPTPSDHKDALFCCSNSRRIRCCTAEDLQRHGKLDESLADTGNTGDQQSNSNVTPVNNIDEDESENERSGETQTCNDNHPILTLLRICSASGDSRNLKRCCKRSGDRHRYCCTEEEFQENIRGILVLENTARRKDVVVKVLGASIFVLMCTVFIVWYCCVRTNRKREYKFIGIYEPLIKDKQSNISKNLYYNADPETLKKHIYV